MSKQIPKISVRATARGFAVVAANGEILRDGFRTLQVAYMWAGRKGLHKGKLRTKYAEIEIPDALMDERIFGIPFYANLQNRPYQRFLPEAKDGKWGKLIQLTSRTFGIRFGDYRRSVAAREIQTK